MANYKYYIIYKTTNQINCKYYIGAHRTNNLDDGYLGSGINIRNAIKKYGESNFKREILFFLKSETELNQKEIDLITPEIIADKMSYNMALGGQGGDFRSGTQDSEEIKQKKKLAKAGKKHPMFGRFGATNPTAKSFIIGFSNGNFILITGLREFCKQWKYDQGACCGVMIGKCKHHKDIVSVIKL